MPPAGGAMPPAEGAMPPAGGAMPPAGGAIPPAVGATPQLVAGGAIPTGAQEKTSFTDAEVNARLGFGRHSVRNIASSSYCRTLLVAETSNCGSACDSSISAAWGSAQSATSQFSLLTMRMPALGVEVTAAASCPMPPAGGAMPPAAGAMPPAGAAMLPAGCPMPPAGGTMPPAAAGGAMPPAGGAMPPAGGAKPPAGGAMPPAGGAMPPGGGAMPPAGGAMPPAGGAVLAAGRANEATTGADSNALDPTAALAAEACVLFKVAGLASHEPTEGRKQNAVVTVLVRATSSRNFVIREEGLGMGARDGVGTQ